MHQVASVPINYAVVTISDTRTVETDKSGKLIASLMAEYDHTLIKHVIIPDETEILDTLLQTLIDDERVQLVLLTGGTGISKRDRTIEIVDSYIQKEMPGFGELFRMLSYTEDIGSAAILSRATAGVMLQNKVVFAMPGSTGAVKLAMQKLILPQIAHIHHELYKH